MQRYELPRQFASPTAPTPTPAWSRWLLLFFILVTFARVTWRLDANNLWWDESLSLQRAESAWLPLLRGDLVMHDGFSTLPTTDQHPFFFFVVLGVLIRLAGISEYVLRFPAVMAVTLLTPVAWVLARYYIRRAVFPPTAELWAAGFAAVHPFFLWYGQEARPYALWAMLMLLSLYLLLRCVETPTPAPALVVGYALVTLMALASHYYAVFWLPLHALLLYQWLSGRSRTLGLAAGIGILAGGALISAFVAWLILSQGGGSNFPEISLGILIPDLVNAFSMGLSVTLDDPVHWLGWLFGVLALLGAGWSLRSQKALRNSGWLLPVAVILPIGAVLVLNIIQPAYMNARHLSLIGGAYILLVGGGLALLWRYQQWLGSVVGIVLLAGLIYSSANYFDQPEFGKDDYQAMGAYLTENLLPGDLLLLSPPFSWRIFNYYLPIAEIDHAAQAGRKVAHYGTPLLSGDWDGTYAKLAEFTTQYRRIWLARSGTHPYLDPEGRVGVWLAEHSASRLREIKFFSPTSFLDLELFLPQPPVYESMEPPAQQRVDIRFGEKLHLVGYDLLPPLTPTSALPVTLYWQVDQKPTARYKYILQLVTVDAAGQLQVLTQMEQEPYNGEIPTIWWDPGKTIVEYTNLPPLVDATPIDVAVKSAFDAGQRYQLALQIYDAESLEKLPVVEHEAAQLGQDTVTALMPFVLPAQR
ncbi:MAG: glycosyltransferase family 39 protein [Caldilineaceae bacterium]